MNSLNYPNRNELLTAIDNLKNTCMTKDELLETCQINNSSNLYRQNLDNVYQMLSSVIEEIKKNDNIKDLSSFQNPEICKKYLVTISDTINQEEDNLYNLNVKIPFNSNTKKLSISIKNKLTEIKDYCQDESFNDVLYGNDYLTRKEIVNYAVIQFVEILNIISVILSLILSNNTGNLLFDTSLDDLYNNNYFVNKINSLLTKIDTEQYTIPICREPNISLLKNDNITNLVDEFKFLNLYNMLLDKKTWSKTNQQIEETKNDTDYKQYLLPILEQIGDKNTETNIYRKKNIIKNSRICEKQNHLILNHLNDNETLKQEFIKGLTNDINTLRYLYLSQVIDLLTYLFGKKDDKKQMDNLIVYCNNQSNLNSCLTKDINYTKDKLYFTHTDDLINRNVEYRDKNIYLIDDRHQPLYLMKNDTSNKSNNLYQIIEISNKDGNPLEGVISNVDELQFELKNVKKEDEMISLNYDNKRILETLDTNNNWKINFNIDIDKLTQIKNELIKKISSYFIKFETIYNNSISKIIDAYNNTLINYQEDTIGGKKHKINRYKYNQSKNKKTKKNKT